MGEAVPNTHYAYKIINIWAANVEVVRQRGASFVAKHNDTIDATIADRVFNLTFPYDSFKSLVMKNGDRAAEVGPSYRPDNDEFEKLNNY